MNDAVKIIPAIVATGPERFFIIVSKYGMYNETISNNVATAKAMSAGVEPIQAKPSDNVISETFSAMEVIKSGVNTRNPAAALNPMPIKIAMIISIITTLS